MSLKFNEVFVGLLTLSFLTAFVFPSRWTNPIRSVQGIFYPVAAPSRAIGLALNQRLSRPPKDDRSVVDIREENARLRQSLSTLTAELEDLRRVNADRQVMFDVRKLCTPVSVIGTDAGTRDSLVYKGANFESFDAGTPVLYTHGVVGRIERVGQIQLVTDRNFGVAGEFRRLVDTESGGKRYDAVGQTPPWVQGTGKGTMVISNVPMSETSAELNNAIHVDDVVMLHDPEWGSARGQVLGTVVKIQPQQNVRLLAEITVKPTLNLVTLREVMVMNKTAGATTAPRSPDAHR